MRSAYFASTFLVGVAILAPGLAQAAEAAADTAIEEVIVTAQRREQSLQKVPVAVTAVTASDVEKAGVTAVEQLQQLSPGLVHSQSISASTPYLRGVGSTQGGAGSEAAVSTYIDGVYIGPTLGGVFSFNNLERIEVLRGPQGTLFGRNATGGLINIITKNPTQEFEAKASATYESYQKATGNFYMAGGVADGVSAGLALFGQKQGKGYGTNVTLNEEINYRDEVAGRGKVVFEPNDRLTISLSADYDWRSDDGGLWRNIYPGTVGLAGTRPLPDPHDAQSDVGRRTNLTQGGVSARVQYDLGFATFSSITAYREYLTKISYDQDNTPIRVVKAFFHHSDGTWQQEFLLQGGSERFNWTTGLFFFSDATDLKLGITSLTTPASNFLQQAYQTTRSYAAFGQADYAIFEGTRLTVGLRFTRDEQDFAGNRYALIGNPRPEGTVLLTLAGAENAAEKVTYRFALDHEFSDTVMGYLSYSRGFKTGGFNINDLTQPPIRPEILDAFEGGVKSQLFDRRARLNASAFYYDYKDIQAQSSTAGITRTLNASRGELYGGELEVEVLPRVSVGELRLRGTAAYLHARYESFPNSPFFVPNPATCTPVPQSTGPATGGNTTCVVDVSGNTMVRSPEFTVSLSADYTIPVGEGQLQFSGDFYHSSSFFWLPDNRITQPSYEVFNGQVSYAFGNGLRVRAFGKNLLDKTYYYWGFSSSLGDGAFAAPPRTFGVGVDYAF